MSERVSVARVMLYVSSPSVTCANSSKTSVFTIARLGLRGPKDTLDKMELGGVLVNRQPFLPSLVFTHAFPHLRLAFLHQRDVANPQGNRVTKILRCARLITGWRSLPTYLKSWSSLVCGDCTT